MTSSMRLFVVLACPGAALCWALIDSVAKDREAGIAVGVILLTIINLLLAILIPKVPQSYNAIAMVASSEAGLPKNTSSSRIPVFQWEKLRSVSWLSD